MGNNQSKYFTAIVLFALAALSWYGFTNIGSFFFGGGIFGDVLGSISTVVIGFPLAIIFTSMFAIFGIAALMLDVQQYPQFFLASLLAVVALILWLSPADIPGPVEELVVSLVSGLFFKKSLTKKKTSDTPISLL